MTCTRLLIRPSGRVLLVFALTTSFLHANRFYVSTTGNDANGGTIDAPFKTIAKAVSLSTLAAGDTIYVRGGVYPCSTTISISKSGNSSTRNFLHAYPSERVLVDFSIMPIASTSRGVSLAGSYWHVKGFDFVRARDNGMNISGSNNIIEFCSFAENGDTGLQLGGGASNNQVINCDAFFNVDNPGQGNADGFSPKLDVGTGNSFYGCRSWQNSDDGWDGYLRPATNVTTTLENCWCFSNGYLKDGSPSLGNGNGFKLGGSDTKDLMHNFILKNCIAFDNRVKGFDQNNNRGSMTLYNCTGYRNGTYNFSLGSFVNYAQGKIITVINSLALGAYGTIRDSAIQQTNSWIPPIDTVTEADFISIDTTGVRGPRNADGSLPDIQFLHLASTSHLVNAGTNVGLPFNGSAPDLGAFETNVGTFVADDARPTVPNEVRILGNYPNPFNPSTTIVFETGSSCSITLAIYDILGRAVRTYQFADRSAGRYEQRWDGRDATGHFVGSGVYFISIRSDNAFAKARLLLVK